MRMCLTFVVFASVVTTHGASQGSGTVVSVGTTNARICLPDQDGEQFNTTTYSDRARSSAVWGSGRLTRGIGGGSGRHGDLVVGPGQAPNLNTVTQTFPLGWLQSNPPVQQAYEIIARLPAGFSPTDKTTWPTASVRNGAFEFSRFVVQSNGTVRFDGAEPARVYSRGNMELQGIVDVSGRTPADHASDAALGEPGAAGGPAAGSGGKGATRNDSAQFAPGLVAVGGLDVPNADFDPNGSSGRGVGNISTLAAGTGGTIFPVVFPSANVTSGSQAGGALIVSAEGGNSCRVLQVASPGGGGAYATDGGAAQPATIPGGTLPTTIAVGGSASSIGLEAPTAPPIIRKLEYNLGYLRGGSGGGGGGLDMFWSSSIGFPPSCSGPGIGYEVFRDNSAASGGGGGGALQLVSGGTLSVNGLINLRGGIGGSASTDASNGFRKTHAQPGGGGSGGALRMQAKDVELLPPVAGVNVVDVRGGAGGVNRILARGGAGGAGLVRLEDQTGLVAAEEFGKILPNDAPTVGTSGQNILSVGDWATPRVHPDSYSAGMSCWMKPTGNFFEATFTTDDPSINSADDYGWNMNVIYEVSPGVERKFSYRGRFDGDGNPAADYPVPGGLDFETALGNNLNFDLGAGEAESYIAVRFQGAVVTGTLLDPCAVVLTGPTATIVPGSETAWMEHPESLNAFLPRPNMIRFVVVFDTKQAVVAGSLASKIKGVTDLRIAADLSEFRIDPPADLGPCKLVAAGLGHSLALRQDGMVRGWGGNLHGQSTVPPDLGACSMVAAGTEHSLAIKVNGQIRAWGRNDDGQCSVPAISGRVLSISGGRSHSLALTETGAVIAWGANADGQCNVPSSVSGYRAIAAGVRHSLAIALDGQVLAWGDNSRGACSVPPGLGPCRAVAAGDGYSLAIRLNGSVVGWGANQYGQCIAPAGSYRSVAAGGAHSVGLLQNGQVEGWGANTFGKIQFPPSLGPCFALAAGGAISLLIEGYFDCDGDGIADQNEIAAGAPDCDADLMPDTCGIAIGLPDCNANLVPDGCETSGGAGDCNGNGVPDDCDLTAGASDCDLNSIPDSCQFASGARDCNANGQLDWCDVTSGYSSDMNGDNFPDECGLDCNGNGYADALEVSVGAAADCDGDLLLDECELALGQIDCNGNGVPDTCELVGGQLDCNGNGTLDVCDVLGGAPDCNGNRRPDACDIQSGQALDCNSNGIPDGCDLASGRPDCNLNQVIDACDIASGFSSDANADGIPDDCSLDCNGNGLLDTAEVAQGISPDCNTNQVPDSCDLLAGVPDCNFNQVPDSCDVAAGLTDCNGNLSPDSCDLASGLTDCDGNGRLDICDVALGAPDCDLNGQPDTCDDDLNADGVVDACQDGGVSYCFGTGPIPACPCGLAGGAGNGCPNSASPQGARLTAAGLPSRVADSLVLTGANMPASSSVLYFQGTLASGGTVFGDGLRCVQGAIIRLAITNNQAGTSLIPSPGSTPIHQLGAIPPFGAVTRYYQAWYRDASLTFCSSSRFNLTNGVAVVWVP